MIINFILLLVARLLIKLLAPLSFIYFHLKMIVWLVRFGKTKTLKYMSEYYLVLAISIDQTGNVLCKDLFNDWMLKDSKRYKYGHPDQTVSHVTGVNYNKKNLRLIGKILAFILNRIEKNHVQKAAISEQYKNKY